MLPASLLPLASVLGQVLLAFGQPLPRCSWVLTPSLPAPLPPAASLLSLCTVRLSFPSPPPGSAPPPLSCGRSVLFVLAAHSPASFTPSSFVLSPIFLLPLAVPPTYPLFYFYFSFHLSIRFSLSFSHSPDVFSFSASSLQGQG